MFVESTSHSDLNVLREFSILLIWDADERRGGNEAVVDTAKLREEERRADRDAMLPIKF